MKIETLALTYARALLELAEEKGKVEEVHDEAACLERLLREEKDLRTFVESPRVSKSEKRKVIEATLRGRLSDETVNFLLLMIEKGRQVLVLESLRQFAALYDERMGILRAHLATAVPVAEAQAEALRGRLEKSLKKRVLIEKQVDASILGGFIIRYAGMVADASLRTALAEIGKKMRGPQFGSELVHEN